MTLTPEQARKAQQDMRDVYWRKPTLGYDALPGLRRPDGTVAQYGYDAGPERMPAGVRRPDRTPDRPDAARAGSQKQESAEDVVLTMFNWCCKNLDSGQTHRLAEMIMQHLDDSPASNKQALDANFAARRYAADFLKRYPPSGNIKPDDNMGRRIPEKQQPVSAPQRDAFNERFPDASKIARR